MASKEITAATFGSIINTATTPVLIDFWATWCGPCRSLAPSIEAISEELAGKLTVYKCNVDEERSLATKFRIVSIPTLMLFKDGQMLQTWVGDIPKRELQREIETRI
ncbi:MAG: thioredoxin [Atopobiaceae bacterium]|jgi:thioredoxin 1